jgi:predicted RNase H-like HicB family nuclease
MSDFTCTCNLLKKGGILAASALPGCVTQGETKEEALTMIRDAIAGYLASLRKHGEPIPQGLQNAEVEVVEVEWADIVA